MSDILERAQPLEDRVFAAIKDKKFFTSSDVIEFFGGRENTQSLYRAIKKLVADGRIKYEGYVDRKKVYTSRGDSALPYFKTVQGEALPLTYMLTGLTQGAYNEDYTWPRLKELNKLMPLLSRLFVIAQFDDPKNKQVAFNNTIKELNEIRKTLTWMISLINDVYKHPAMKGDMAYFTRTFNGKDDAMPTIQQINDFKVWYKHFMDTYNAE